MATFTARDVDHYGGQGGTGYFSIKNDGECKKVRFLYRDVEDVMGYAVHQVEIDGKKRYVNCIRNYDDPVDACPFCKAQQYQMAKVFVPIYNITEQKVQVWERGKQFLQKLGSVFSRYDKYPIVSQVFEIERNGKPNDTKTTYEIYRTDDPADDTRLDDFEMPNILGGLILDKTADEMDFYLRNGYFEGASSERPQRRTSERERVSDDRDYDVRPNYEERPRRRTPARNEDTF